MRFESLNTLAYSNLYRCTCCNTINQFFLLLSELKHRVKLFKNLKFTASQIAGILEGEIDGNPDVAVHKLAKIEEGEIGSLTFLANPK